MDKFIECCKGLIVVLLAVLVTEGIGVAAYNAFDMTGFILSGVIVTAFIGYIASDITIG